MADKIVGVVSEHVVFRTGDVVDEQHLLEGAVVGIPSQREGAFLRRLKNNGTLLVPTGVKSRL
jgi:hypothetical protein